jgi:hypothetical protein
MRRSIVRFLTALVAYAVCLSCCPVTSLHSAAAAAEPQHSTPRISRRADPRIRKALAERTTLEFVEAPLQDVVDYLKDVHSIEIQIDTNALEAAAIGPDTPITRNLKNISLEAALDTMLRAMALTWVSDGEVITITTPDAAQSGLCVRLYDCGWATAEQLPTLVEVLKLVDVRPQVVEKVKDGDGDEPATKEGKSDFKLVAFGSTIVVRATALEHETIVRLLAELRATVDAKGTEPAPVGKAR